MSVNTSQVEKVVTGLVDNAAPDLKKKVQVFFVELIMETLRTAYLAAYPILLFALTSAALTGQFDLNTPILGFTAALAALKGLDRALYESGIFKKGIARF